MNLQDDNSGDQGCIVRALESILEDTEEYAGCKVRLFSMQRINDEWAQEHVSSVGPLLDLWLSQRGFPAFLYVHMVRLKGNLWCL